MKKILVAGYGSIGKALQNVARYHHMEYKFEYIDNQLNCSIEEYFKMGKCDDSIDTLVNLTGCTSKEILLMCNENNINYIDTGIEVNSMIDGTDMLDAFESFKNTELNIKAIIGAGMNPGIIELIYSKYKPQFHHAAIEVEVDSADCIISDDVYNTWSPASFYTEFYLNNTYYYNKNLVPLYKKANQVFLEGMYKSNLFRFNMVPHEEILSMAQSTEKCLLSAFLYSPPQKMRDYLASSTAEEISNVINKIPVHNDIIGEDCVGVLIYNMEQENALLNYYFNSANHQKCYEKYGINGTSWQVACGVLSALHIVNLLAEDKVYTMTEVSYKFCNVMMEFLETIDFHICRMDLQPDQELIKKLRVI